AIHEEHTASGAHRLDEQAFPDWVPTAVCVAAAGLSEEDALSQLPSFLR
ncbi:MAG: hypothetical protein QOG97_3496, partial [Acidimicrobiaceae bacterium]|nr:hypothetical protein [Acidimicrobiaceae bacterium]